MSMTIEQIRARLAEIKKEEQALKAQLAALTPKKPPTPKKPTSPRTSSFMRMANLIANTKVD